MPLSDPTTLANLVTARDGVAAEMAAYVASKPSSSVGGQSVQWDAHYEGLSRRFNDLQGMIVLLSGPVEIVTQGAR